MIKWFIENYPEYVTKMRECTYHSDNYTNLHHLEGDVWSHTMLSFSKGLTFGVSKFVLMALLLHDIGRIKTRYVKEDGFVDFDYFEGVSCYIAVDILNKLNLLEDEKVRILKIIMHQYNVIDFVKYDRESLEQFISKYKYDEELLKDLFSYVKCDLFGRFIDKSKSKYYNLKKILEYEKMVSSLKVEQTSKIDNNKRDAYFLIGPQCSGKSSWIKENIQDAYIISRDQCVCDIGKKYGADTHDQAYALEKKNKDVQYEIDELYNKVIEDSYITNKPIIVDNLNLSYKKRLKWINRYKKTHNIVGVVFLKSFSELRKCDEVRSRSEQKTIGHNLYIGSLKKFNFPLINEGFNQIKYVF